MERLEIYDFDSTLFFTPDNTKENIKSWEEKTGKLWNKKGWWGKLESIDIDVFDIKANIEVVKSAKIGCLDPGTLCILMTGRIPRFEPVVRLLAQREGLEFQRYIFNGSNHPTLDFKIKMMKDILNEFPDIKHVEIWEDRVLHVQEFTEFGKTLDGYFKVHQV